MDNTENQNYTAIKGQYRKLKSDVFSEKFQTAFDRKIILQFFYNEYGCIYASRYGGKIV